MPGSTCATAHAATPSWNARVCAAKRVGQVAHGSARARAVQRCVRVILCRFLAQPAALACAARAPDAGPTSSGLAGWAERRSAVGACCLQRLGGNELELTLGELGVEQRATGRSYRGTAVSAVTPGATRVTSAPAALVVAVGLVLAMSDDDLDEVREDVGNAGQL